MFLVILWSSILLFLLYLYLKKGFSYWKKRNIPHPEPNIFFGNMTDAILMKKSMGEIYAEIYNAFPDVPYVGIYKLRQPALLIRDPELLQTLLIKDFSYFDENDFKVDADVDPIAGGNPFFQTGDKWKTTRSRLSHCFSSGKMKAILPLMIKVANDMIKYLEDERKLGNTTFETKELCTKFTTDNVASCAFGLEGRSFLEKDAAFRKIVQMTLNQSTPTAIKLMLIIMVPALGKFLKFKLFPDEAEKYFRNIVATTLEYRLKNNITRNDFLDIMNELRNTDLNYTIDDVLGHCLSFLADGTETSGLSLSFTLFELAANVEIQEKLREEIGRVLAKEKGKITYEGLQDMSYLECCILEAMRMHPAAMFLGKVCTKPYEFEPISGNKEKLKVDVGTPVVFPTKAVHNDDKLYPEPDVYKPERFSDENKSSLPKGGFIPFGGGPRACVGQRFAMLQLKVAIVTLLTNFDLKLSSKMKLPLEYSPKYFMLVAKDGLWLEYHKRDV